MRSPGTISSNILSRSHHKWRSVRHFWTRNRLVGRPNDHCQEEGVNNLSIAALQGNTLGKWRRDGQRKQMGLTKSPSRVVDPWERLRHGYKTETCEGSTSRPQLHSHLWSTWNWRWWWGGGRGIMMMIMMMIRRMMMMMILEFWCMPSIEDD